MLDDEQRGPDDEQRGPEDGQRGQPVPRGSGRARELVRGARGGRRTAASPGVDTGRRHHIGDAPQVLPFLRPDGSVGTTRTSPVQLRDRNDAQLAALAAAVEREMHEAAGALDYEGAAHLREELAAVRREVLARRGAGEDAGADGRAGADDAPPTG